MAPQLSQEIRQCMVAWSQELGKSNAKIAQLATCSEHTVCDVLRLEHEFGVIYTEILYM
jgi:transposase